ncbi:hypothetical protein HYH02_000258 [Chlamydomonas schloesseri]|uniref:Uncharacterized protein n=1 Tax=Chlamydomonas schloesseri TaxID=2026947 RepID=A0A836B7P0_9CHLO|nr:hypothetical protein HYH02_000258 [Chlamydomonas schloesseri]|eukprot:KAG2450156.1 hypothetical protein HYH02_000258 [Chlamydomonas schloesseri]
MTGAPTSLGANVAGPSHDGPRGVAQQTTTHSLDMIQALKRKVDAIRFNEAALKQRLAQTEARCEQLVAQLAAAKATHVAGSDPTAEQQLQAARAEVARLQANLAAALNANMANLETTLALKRETKERVDRVIAEAERLLQQQAELARERERVLLLEAGRLQQVAAHWEARAHSLEARMASAAASPVQGQEGRRQEQQQQQAASGLAGVKAPLGIIRLGRADSGGVAAAAPPAAVTAAATAAAATAGTATAAMTAPLHGVVPAPAGGAQAHGGTGPAPRQPAVQQFGLPVHTSPLDMLAAIASALIPVQPPRPAPKPRGNPLAPLNVQLKHVAPGGTSAAAKQAPGRPRKHPLPSGPAGAPEANTLAAAPTAAAGAGAIGEGHAVMHRTVLAGTATALKRGPGRPRKHPLPPGKGGAPGPATGVLGDGADAAVGAGTSSGMHGQAHTAAPAPKRGRGRPPKPKPSQEAPAAAVAAATPAGFTADSGVSAGSGAGPRENCERQQQPALKRARLNDGEVPVAAARIAGPRPRCSPERAVVLPAVCTAAVAASPIVAAAAATAAAPAPTAAAAGEQVRQPGSVPAGGRAVEDHDGLDGGGQLAQEAAPLITISSSSSDEAGSSGAAGAGKVDGLQAEDDTAAPHTCALQGPCAQAGSATSDGGRSFNAGGSSTDTTPFSPSQVVAEVNSSDAARKVAHAGPATAAGGSADAVASTTAAAAAAVKDEEPAGMDTAAGGAGPPCCVGTTCGHAPARGCRKVAPPAAPEARSAAPGAAARAHVAAPQAAPAPAPPPRARAHAPPPPAPAAATRQPRMGLGAAEAVMRRLYLDVLVAARAVPGAAAAFETRAALEQLPGFGRCVPEQDLMFFARIDARIGGRRAGFSRAAPLRYASPDALRADFARIMDNCHAYLNRAGSGGGGGGGSPSKAGSRSLLDTAVAVLEAVDVQLEAVRSSAELAEALEAVEAMEHKLECRDCGKWRRLRGYGRFVRIRCEFSCGKLPGRACREPCDVCNAESDCECDD